MDTVIFDGMSVEVVFAEDHPSIPLSDVVINGPIDTRGIEHWNRIWDAARMRGDQVAVINAEINIRKAIAKTCRR